MKCFLKIYTTVGGKRKNQAKYTAFSTIKQYKIVQFYTLMQNKVYICRIFTKT